MVGSQVLGAFVYGLYYSNPILSIVNYASIVLAAVGYAFVFGKFYRANRVVA
ncbi:MAG: hypothetical protein Q8K89_04270 [Actinomycetota bacterium]|nr:hypothetical protein [Actinomycetota bacterium]